MFHQTMGTGKSIGTYHRFANNKRSAIAMAMVNYLLVIVTSRYKHGYKFSDILWGK